MGERISILWRSGKRPLWYAALLSLIAAATALSSAAAFGAWPNRSAPSANDQASTFAVRAVSLLAGNRYASAWLSLHPAHQRVADRAVYSRCESTSSIPGRVQAVSVRSVRDERTLIPGVGYAMTKAVAITVVVVGEAAPEGVRVDHVVHVLRAEGRWRWVLPAARYAAYSEGRCIP